MNSEEIIEEILYNSHQEKIFDEVLKMAMELQKEFPLMSQVESYERSYETVKKK